MTNKSTEGEKILDIKLYSMQEVAKLLKVTEKTIQTYIKNERLKAQKIGRRWKITESNFRKFISAE